MANVDPPSRSASLTPASSAKLSRRRSQLAGAYLLSLGTASHAAASLAAASLATLSLAAACTPAATIATSELQIGGMVCASCSEAITFALQKLDGVESVTIDHTTGHAQVRHDPARTSREAIVQVITGMGYTASP